MPVRAISVVAALAAAIVLGPPASATAPKRCAGIHGYRVSASSVSCTFATSWVSKLTHRAQVPAGWTCNANGSVSVLHVAFTIGGTCYTGSASSPLKLFRWNVVTSGGQTPPFVGDPTVTTTSGSPAPHPKTVQLYSGGASSSS